VLWGRRLGVAAASQAPGACRGIAASRPAADLRDWLEPDSKAEAATYGRAQRRWSIKFALVPKGADACAAPQPDLTRMRNWQQASGCIFASGDLQAPCVHHFKSRRQHCMQGERGWPLSCASNLGTTCTSYGTQGDLWQHPSCTPPGHDAKPARPAKSCLFLVQPAGNLQPAPALHLETLTVLPF
jgi:hypothetical protein